MLGKDHGGIYKAATTEESERLKGEGGKVEFIYFKFERGQVARFRKARRRQHASQIACTWDEQ